MSADPLGELAQWVLAREADYPEEACETWAIFADALEEHFGPKHFRTTAAREMAKWPSHKVSRFIACFGDRYRIQAYRDVATYPIVLLDTDLVSIISFRGSHLGPRRPLTSFGRGGGVGTYQVPKDRL